MTLFRPCRPATDPTGRKAATLSLAVLAGTVVAPAAHAQDVSEGQGVAEALSLDPVIVNTRKIEEEVQRIPFGISVFGAESIERERVSEVRDFARETPGMNFVDIGLRGGNLPNIRGVGTFTPISPDDTSVPAFIDGIPVPLRAFGQEFFDIEQIMVLGGPQNTAFGGSAQAGAINLRSDRVIQTQES